MWVLVVVDVEFFGLQGEIMDIGELKDEKFCKGEGK